MLNVQSLTQRTFAQIVVFALLLLNSTLAFAQNQVNGIVTDKTGEPLIGVNVVEKGTTNGVITDFNGQFTLNVAQGKTLVFSYVGYTTQEITVKGSSLKIIMEEDSKTLDEVVVVGYGSMSRKDVTSSITTVKADKLNVGVYSDKAATRLLVQLLSLYVGLLLCVPVRQWNLIMLLTVFPVCH